MLTGSSWNRMPVIIYTVLGMLEILMVLRRADRSKGKVQSSGTTYIDSQPTREATQKYQLKTIQWMTISVLYDEAYDHLPPIRAAA